MIARRPAPVLFALAALTLVGPGLFAGDYVGRWNVLILEERDTFHSAWFEFTEVDGKLEGRAVWKWGSVVPLKDVHVEDGELRFARDGQSGAARIVSGELLGSVRSAKKTQYFVGRPASELCRVGGRWKLTSADGESIGSLELKENGQGISGQATNAEGVKFQLSEVSLKGRELRFQATPDNADNVSVIVEADVRGDHFAAIAVVKGPDGEGEHRLTGVREREWGEPVRLLDAGVDGFHPRDPNKKFGWRIEDGVLINSPPDVDIVSKKEFSDFQLELEYRVGKGKNSGVYLRGRYELQVLGNTNVRPHGNMAVYSRLSPKVNPLRTPLETTWQKLEVTMIGRFVTVKLNGTTVHDNAYLPGITGGAYDPWEGDSGPIMLQGDHGKVEYRNIVVRPAK